MFAFKIDQYSMIYAMIMSNVKPECTNTKVKYVFDMKGSEVNRTVMKWKLVSDIKSMPYTENKVLKDIDFCYLKYPKKLIRMEPDVMQMLLTSIQIDVKFLMDQGFMDYSLLLCIR